MVFGAPLYTDIRTQSADALLQLDLEDHGFGDEITWDPGPMEFKSLTSYREYEQTWALDFDVSELNLIFSAPSESSESILQEFQLASSSGGQTLQGLSYIVSGSDESAGELLIFLHGLMMSKEVWEAQLNHFCDQYRIIAADFAGFGQSTNTALPYSYADHAVDVRQLLQYNHADKVHLVGWSMGACVAVNFAVLFPAELTTLTLVDASPKGVKSADFPWSVESDAAAAMLATLASDRELMTKQFVAQVLSGCTDEALHRKILNIAMNTEPGVALRHLRNGINSDLRLMLDKIQIPTLLISGELDIFSPAQANEFMAQQINNATWIEIAGAGHAPFLTKTEEFNTCLKRFLRNAGA